MSVDTHPSFRKGIMELWYCSLFQWSAEHSVLNHHPIFWGGPRLARGFLHVFNISSGMKMETWVNNLSFLWVACSFISTWIFNLLLSGAPHLEAMCKSQSNQADNKMGKLVKFTFTINRCKTNSMQFLIKDDSAFNIVPSFGASPMKINS